MGNETAGRVSLLRRLGTAAGSAAAGLVLVTGCAAGQNAQTVEQTPSIDGVQAEAGSIAIRAAGIVSPESGASYAKGSSAPLRMVLINRGGQADRLVSVSSPVAGGVQLGTGAGASGSSAGSASPSASSSSAVSPSASSSAPASSASSTASSTASGTATATSSGSGTSTASGTATATSSPSGTASATSSAASSAPPSSSAPASSSPSASPASTPINLPARQSVQIGMGDGGATVTLTGLTAELFPSQSVPVTLTFASGTSVTVVLAVQLTSEAPSAPTVSEATEHGGE